MEEKLLSHHVIIFPLPVQGHLNSMLKLAELLSLAGLNITFLNSDNNQKRLLRYTDIHARFANYSGFQFKTFSDGLPEDHPRTVDQAREILEATNLSGKPFLKDLLTDIRPPVSCIIGDGILGFVSDVATELKIPLIHFRTASACSFWTYFCIPQLIQAGELPLKGKEGMDRLLTTVPGMEEFLRGRDLPSFCRVNDINNGLLQLVVNETVKSSEVDGLLLNTFEDLEGPVLSHIRTKCPKIYTIGPLHLHLQARLAAANDMKPSQLSSNSLWEVDKSCMSWLDKQPSQSVIYVSFGSLAVFTREQLMEFWYGLVNSEHRFLWVIRPGSVGGDDDSAMELVEGTKERGYMVGWAPQEEVLAHKAIGGFLTHSGWNSTLESIVAGVPMICWPCFGDQQVNSRYVSEVWKIGVDMKDVCDRKIVEKMVNDLMVDRREEFLKSADKFATLARRSISEGGSSCCSLDHLINDIMDMSSQAHSI